MAATGAQDDSAAAPLRLYCTVMDNDADDRLRNLQEPPAASAAAAELGRIQDSGDAQLDRRIGNIAATDRVSSQAPAYNAKHHGVSMELQEDVVAQKEERLSIAVCPPQAANTNQKMLALGMREPALRTPGIQRQDATIEQEQPKPLSLRLASPTSCATLVTPICTRGQVYPPPLATHDEVIRDPSLFMDTLCKFHEAMGSRMTSPRMGGNQLDLYRLYQEVTARGGLEQVIKDRLWKDIKAVFNFPKTTTSASFVLRKYYTSLLHHYEQVYFFRAQGQLISPPAPIPAPSPVLQSPESVLFSEEAEPGLKKRRIQPLIDVDPGAPIGQTVTGSIEEKFEHGYLVTVVIGSEKFRGVLYNVPAGTSAPQFAALPRLMNSIGSAEANPPNVGVRLRRRRRRLGLRRKDPSAPKLNRSGYNYFFAEQRAKLKLMYPDKDREISKMIGESWSSMTEEQKLPYQERGVKDKERYKEEMRDYRERIKMQRSPGEASGGMASQLVCQQDKPGLKEDEAVVQDNGDRSGYNIFFAEQQAKLKLLCTEKDREICKLIGDSWNTMTEEQKLPYRDCAIKEVMREYWERIKMQRTAGSGGIVSQPIEKKHKPEDPMAQDDKDDNHQVSLNKPELDKTGLGQACALPSAQEQQQTGRTTTTTMPIF